MERYAQTLDRDIRAYMNKYNIQSTMHCNKISIKQEQAKSTSKYNQYNMLSWKKPSPKNKFILTVPSYYQEFGSGEKSTACEQLLWNSEFLLISPRLIWAVGPHLTRGEE